MGDYKTLMLSKGGMYGSRFDSLANSIYNDAINGGEYAILLRKVYLPLYPLERYGKKVAEAIELLYQEELMPTSEYHPKGYWYQEDVYAKFYEGNFYIPSIVPNLNKYGENPFDFKSEVTKYEIPELNIIAGELGGESEYKKLSFTKLLIPGDIAMKFRSSIPEKTVFSISSMGGSLQTDNIRINAVISIPKDEDVEPDEWRTKEQKDYEAEEMTIEEIADEILEHLEIIEEEEDSRNKWLEELKAQDRGD